MPRALRVAVAGLLPALLVVAIAVLPHQPTYAQGVCVTQQPGVVAWYPGDGDTKDYGRANHGALQGHTTYAAGRAGQAFLFDGNTDAVSVGNPAHLQLQTFTIEAWVKRNSTTQTTIDSANGGSIFSYGLNGYTFHLVNNGHLAFGKVGVNAIETQAQNGGPELKITDTTFHHVAVVKFGNTVTFYLDGVASAGITYTNAFEFTTNASVGARGDTFLNSLLGVVDELTIYDRALLPADIQAIATAGAAGKCKETRVSLQHATYPNGEASGPYELTARRTGDATAASTVGYATTDGTAVAGQDYTATTGTLTFAAGELVKTIQVPVTADTVAEPDEAFQIALSTPAGAVLVAPSSAALTLFNTVPGPGRIIVPSTHLGSFGTGLLAYNTDGSNGIQLTPVEAGTHVVFASVARRTGHIAFEACGDYDPLLTPAQACAQGRRLFVMNGDGSGLRQVTTSAGLQIPGAQQDARPVISPDGTKIAFLSGRPPAKAGREEIFVINTDGTGLRLITPKLNANQGNDESYAHSVVWSPDSAKLLVHAYREAPGIIGSLYTYNPDGTGETLLVRGMSSSAQGILAIDWAPDGRNILYVSIGGYTLADPQEPGKTRFLSTTQLVGVGGGIVGTAGSVRFSPDGQRIVYGVNGAGSGSTTNGTVRTIKLDGTGVSNVRTNTAEYLGTKWWWGGAALPVASRFELTPDSVLVWTGHAEGLNPTLFDAQNNVIFRAAQWEGTPETGRQCTAALPACVTPNVTPVINALGQVTGSLNNGEVNWCAANAGFTDCVRVLNYDTPIVSVTATTPTASRAGTAGVFGLTRLHRLPDSMIVNFTLAGTATPGTDYTIDATGGTVSGNTITIPPNTSSFSVNVRARSSGGGAGDETVVFTLQANSTYILNDAAKSATVTIKDDAPAPAASLALIAPNKGGDRGRVTVTIHGSRIKDGASVRLARAGQPAITGSAVVVATNQLSATATFNLVGRALGPWDVVLANPDGTGATLTGGFTIEAGGGPQIWVGLVGRYTMRSGRTQRFFTAFGNTGNADAGPTLVRTHLPEGLSLASPAVLPDGTLAAVVHTDAGTTLEFHVPRIAASSASQLTFDTTVDVGLAHNDVRIRVWALSSPLFNPLAAVQLDPTQRLTGEIQVNTPTRFKSLIRLRGAAGEVEMTSEVTTTEIGERRPRTFRRLEIGDEVQFMFTESIPRTASDGRGVSAPGGFKEILKGVKVPKIQLPKITDLEGPITAGVESANVIMRGKNRGGILKCLQSKNLFSNNPDQLSKTLGLTEGSIVLLLTQLQEQKWLALPDSSLADLAATLADGSDEALVDALADGPFRSKPGVEELYARKRIGEQVDDLILQEILELCTCETAPDNAPTAPAAFDPATDLNSCPTCSGGTCPLEAEDTVDLEVVFSSDPNDKVGPQGAGPKHFITGTQPSGYAVFFENKPEATAPAQDVVITDELDGTRLDLSTFQLGPVSFGDRVVTPPAGLTQWTTDVDLRPAKNLIVRVDAGLDLTSSVVRWTFTSLDPATLTPTDDPLAGFLPPNKIAPEGQGSVLFTVGPAASLQTNAEIANDARIVFDVNPPIDTAVWINTIDKTRPSSQVTALAAAQSSTTFTVNWSGTDTGAGIETYDIFVSIAGQPFVPWLQATAATSAAFTGDVNKTYGFYSVARDGAGNEQAPPTAAQATTRISLSAPTDDQDADGLADAWERQFGLDPTKAAGADGGAGDADGDGRSNAQELTAGTHPRGFSVQYFAEGATGTFFRSRIALANPHASQAALVLLRFLKSDGTSASLHVNLPAHARHTVDVGALTGLTAAEFSTVVESDLTIVSDRTMQWDANGYGSHAEAGIPELRNTWYLAEGATHSGFDLFYLIQNPNPAAANVEVTFLLPAPATPLVKTYTVAANSRFNIWVDNADARLTTTDVSAVLTSTTVPIIVERAMYLNSGGRTFGAGHNSAGTTSTATTWLLAEGATGSYFDLFVLVANPNATAATVEARYLLPSGTVVVKTYTVAANSRFSIWVDREDARLADTAVSATLSSTNGVGIIVERAMWWPGSGPTWQEAHNSPGAVATGTVWGLADGEQGGPNQTETYILIANPSSTAGSAKVTLLFEDGTTAERTFAINPNSRFNVNVAAEFQVAAGRRFGATVESLGLSPAQIVVERAMYSNAGGVIWAAGTNALATRLR